MKRKNNLPNRLTFRTCNLRLCPIQHLLEFRNTETHTRVHVGLRALDVIVEVVTEELDVGDSRVGYIGFFEVTGEEN